MGAVPMGRREPVRSQRPVHPQGVSGRVLYVEEQEDTEDASRCFFLREYAVLTACGCIIITLLLVVIALLVVVKTTQ